MAGVITHMVIAKEMLTYLPEDAISDFGMFCLGTLAPDAVHAREGYIRAFKKHSHFRDEIPDRDFELPYNYSLYRKRLEEFIRVNKNRTDGLLDFYRGYVVHILTDELFVRSIRKEFCETMEELGIGQSDKIFFESIVTDMNRNDLLLVNRYPDMKEIRRILEHTDIHPVQGFISSQEMMACRNWLIHQHFVLQQEQLQPVYITYERMLQFIQTAAQKIANWMTEKGNPVQMFG